MPLRNRIFIISSNDVYLVFARQLINVVSVRLKSFKYVTQSTGNRYFLIDIEELNGSFYTDESQNIVDKPCFRCIPMPSTTLTDTVYEAYTSSPDYTFTQVEPLLRTLHIRFVMDGQPLDPAEISAANPVMIELEFNCLN